MKSADLVGDAEHEAGAVMAGGGAALAAEDEESGGVGGVILDIGFDHLAAVILFANDNISFVDIVRVKNARTPAMWLEFARHIGKYVNLAVHP